MSELQGHQVDTNGTDFSWMNVIAVKQATPFLTFCMFSSYNYKGYSTSEFLYPCVNPCLDYCEPNFCIPLTLDQKKLHQIHGIWCCVSHPGFG